MPMVFEKVICWEKIHFRETLKPSPMNWWTLSESNQNLILTLKEYNYEDISETKIEIS